MKGIIFLLYGLFTVVTSQVTSAPKPKYLLAQPVSIENTEGNEFSSPSDEMTPRDTFEKTIEKTYISVDYTITGYYKSRTYYDGQPPSGFITRPSTITPSELEQLHVDCVNRINMYRSGALKFSNGASDSNVLAGLNPTTERYGSNMCSSEGAMGDLIANVAGGGGCAGAHTNAFVCPGGGNRAQNSCCGRGGGSWGDQTSYTTYSSVRSQLYSCLQQMWDEGMGSSGELGHWQTMRSTLYNSVSCGFAWTSNGRVMMTQDFYDSGVTSCNPSCSTCGGSDGCSSNPCVCGTDSSLTAATQSPSPTPSQTPTHSTSSSRTPSPSPSPSIGAITGQVPFCASSKIPMLYLRNVIVGENSTLGTPCV
jgi:hypothetical protein